MGKIRPRTMFSNWYGLSRWDCSPYSRAHFRTPYSEGCFRRKYGRIRRVESSDTPWVVAYAKQPIDTNSPHSPRPGHSHTALRETDSVHLSNPYTQVGTVDPRLSRPLWPKTMPDKGKVRISEIMGHMRLPVAVNRARRASCCQQGELRVEPGMARIAVDCP